MSEILFEVRTSDKALVWYAPEMDQFIIRHVFQEGQFGVFICNEHDSEFAPHWQMNGWIFICDL